MEQTAENDNRTGSHDDDMRSEEKPSTRWESEEAFDERRRTMFGTPDATQHARAARGSREREDPDSGNGHPRQTPRREESSVASA